MRKKQQTKQKQNQNEAERREKSATKVATHTTYSSKSQRKKIK